MSLDVGIVGAVGFMDGADGAKGLGGEGGEVSEDENCVFVAASGAGVVESFN
ncbi:hypothetical protein RintRC_4872 [Richelia intracellularis]|nr:hypothetical protein RintRC_4872 [Richelia intracellularis]